MDTTLVAGLLTIATTTGSGLVGLAGLIVKRHLSFLTKLESNDDDKTKSLNTIATELTRTREVQQDHAADIAALKVSLEDRRLSEAAEAMRGATREIGHITGKHVAVEAERAALLTDEEPAEGQRPARARSGSRPR